VKKGLGYCAETFEERTQGRSRNPGLSISFLNGIAIPSSRSEFVVWGGGGVLFCGGGASGKNALETGGTGQSKRKDSQGLPNLVERKRQGHLRGGDFWTNKVNCCATSSFVMWVKRRATGGENAKDSDSKGKRRRDN